MEEQVCRRNEAGNSLENHELASSKSALRATKVLRSRHNGR